MNYLIVTDENLHLIEENDTAIKRAKELIDDGEKAVVIYQVVKHATVVKGEIRYFNKE